jgi:thiamine biosynthesis lipoprotein
MRFSAFGTDCLVRVPGPVDETREVLTAVRDRAMTIHEEMSVFDPASAVSRLNASAGTGWTSVPDDVARILARASEMGAVTDGAFDVTVGPLASLWKPCIREGRVPSSDEIARARESVGWEHVRVDEAGRRVALDAGTSVDLGGIAKGFAADEFERILRDNGISDALLDLGGSVTVLGAPDEAEAWSVGIQDPLAPTGVPAAQFLVSDTSVVTSGTNERFFVRDGIRYHHVVDPRTGSPTQTGLLGVTFIGPDALVADALATAALVAGAADAVGWARSLGLELVLVFEDGGVVSTSPSVVASPSRSTAR